MPDHQPIAHKLTSRQPGHDPPKDTRCPQKTNRPSLAIRWNGKVAWHQCGTFPDSGIASIRTVRDRARQKVAEGINPSDDKTANRIKEQAANKAIIAEAERKATENLTVADLFNEWLTDGVARQDGNAELRKV